MARAVLASCITAWHPAALALVGLFAACGSDAKKADVTSKAVPLVCTGDISQAPSDLQSAYPPLRQRLEAGLHYQALERRLGPRWSWTGAGLCARPTSFPAMARSSLRSIPGLTSREKLYRGDACNCQARVVYDGEKVIGLVLQSAC